MSRPLVNEHGRFSTIVRRTCVGDFRIGLYCIGSVPGPERPHIHPRTSLSLLLDGAVVTRHAGGDELFQRDGIEVEPACVCHTHHMRASQIAWCTVEIGEDRLRSMPGLDDFLSRPQQIRDPAALHAFRRIARQVGESGSLDSAALEGLTLQLFAALMRLGESRLTRELPAWLRDAVGLIDRRLGGPIQIAGLAREVGLHPVHFAREFRRYLRTTPRDYVRQRRIERAMQLLAQSDSPIAWVAQESGFADQSHMTRMFSRQTGCTPSRFRADLESR